MVLEDDILMWRSILAKYVSDVSDEVKEPPYFTMEQPSSPMQYNPEVVSVWDTKEWLAIKNEFGFTETNFETEKPDQENYSGGADATSLRIIVKKAAVMGWEGLTMDVKTAFLNAELNEEEEDDYVVIKPPAGDDFTGIFWAEGDVLGQAGRIRTSEISSVEKKRPEIRGFANWRSRPRPAWSFEWNHFSLNRMSGRWSKQMGFPSPPLTRSLGC